MTDYSGESISSFGNSYNGAQFRPKEVELETIILGGTDQDAQIEYGDGNTRPFKITKVGLGDVFTANDTGEISLPQVGGADGTTFLKYDGSAITAAIPDTGIPAGDISITGNLTVGDTTTDPTNIIVESDSTIGQYLITAGSAPVDGFAMVNGTGGPAGAFLFHNATNNELRVGTQGSSNVILGNPSSQTVVQGTVRFPNTTANRVLRSSTAGLIEASDSLKILENKSGDEAIYLESAVPQFTMKSTALNPSSLSFQNATPGLVLNTIQSNITSPTEGYMSFSVANNEKLNITQDKIETSVSLDVQGDITATQVNYSTLNPPINVVATPYSVVGLLRQGITPIPTTSLWIVDFNGGAGEENNLHTATIGTNSVPFQPTVQTVSGSFSPLPLQNGIRIFNSGTYRIVVNLNGCWGNGNEYEYFFKINSVDQPGGLRLDNASNVCFEATLATVVTVAPSSIVQVWGRKLQSQNSSFTLYSITFHVERLGEGILDRYANSAALPSVADNEARLVYVDDINNVVFSDGTNWRALTSTSI